MNHFVRHLTIMVLVMLVTLTVTGGACHAEDLYANSFSNANNLKGWTRQQADIKVGDGVEISVIEGVPTKGHCGVWKTFSVDKLKGKVVSCSAEVRGAGFAAASAKHYEGGKFQVMLKSNGKDIYKAAKIRTGTYDWETVSFAAEVPESVTVFRLYLGFQNADSGTLAFRNLKISVEGKQLSLAQVANMGFVDPVEKDGKGGWSDQGPDSDAGNFKKDKSHYGNVPFTVVDPAKNNGKAVLAMRSTHFSAGLEQAELVYEQPLPGKYLYLLHTLCWAKPGSVGQIEAVAANGQKQVIEVIGNRHVADWWRVKKLSDAWPGATWTTRGGNNVGLYVSRFELKLKPSKLIFRSALGEPLWLVVGATVSDRLYKSPEQEKLVITAGKKWKEIKRTASPRVVPGSALDLSCLGGLPLDRVIANSSGHLALKGNPQKSVRFFCGSANLKGRKGYMESNFDTHEKIDAFVEEMRTQGYNMFRIHCANRIVGDMKDGRIKLDPVWLDRLDYFIAKMKEKHIYVMMDCLSRDVGFTGANPWRYDKDYSYSFRIYFDPEIRAHCKEGIRQLLTHVNPYTKTRLAEDPILAIVTGWNEQEFSFIKEQKWQAGAPAWRAFLTEKYGTIDKLNSVWKTGYHNFEEVEAFDRKQIYAADPRGTDLDEFMASCERDLLKWYLKTLRGFGYPGLFTNYDMTKSLHYVAVRGAEEIDVVTMHNYHAHWIGAKLDTQNQGSALAGASKFFRACAGTRITGKPYFVNEYACLFWTRRRYEEAFAFTAYAALNDYDGITRHQHPVSTVNATRISPYESFCDPIAAAQQVQSAFLFLRGDVKPASAKIRIRFNEEDVRKAGIYRDSVNNGQTMLSLIANLSMEPVVAGKREVPMDEKEIAVALAGTSAVENNVAGFSSIIEKTGEQHDLNSTIAGLKGRLIPADNRSRPGLLESCTGELLMDTGRQYMQIDTQRFQGVCMRAGEQAELCNTTVKLYEDNANVSVIALDNTVSDADRLLVIFATNALNSGTTFSNDTMMVRENNGSGPGLLKTGKFVVKIRNSNAKNLTAYALAMNGERRDTLPLRVENGMAILAVDTAKLASGPTVFFELVNQKK